MDRTGLGISLKRRLRWTVVAALVALVPIAMMPLSPRIAHAGTVGTPSNSDVFEFGSYIQSSWWCGASLKVNQRYGCTDVSLEPSAPSGLCPVAPSPYTHWHHGVDIGAGSGTALSSQFDGTVVDVEYATLGIQTTAGNIVYLVHGTPAAGYGTTGVAVHVGDHVYDTDSLIPGGGTCIPAGN